ncbi:BlaI/MecI/CopY family transcriptional regulator [Brachybacterium sp. Marseille-Q7125]|uniref:BlaI/MecI/CopY family transcriptional regulator n=1 Tax=Brachybacterium sp. Marseille-Q7125 TaxID=2932815 RepID=UPI001FF6BC69|nr:BlaI/MecI/CopY family transcriptional regulator [Brachybacterium sp. Marseille-Q7125]
MSTTQTPVHVPLGALERQVMEVLWDRDDLTVRDLIAALGGHHAYTTIATVLANLERKGLTLNRHEGRSALHSAQYTRCEYAARAMEQALVDSPDHRKVFTRLLRRMDREDLALLRECLSDEDEPRDEP